RRSGCKATRALTRRPDACVGRDRDRPGCRLRRPCPSSSAYEVTPSAGSPEPRPSAAGKVSVGIRGYYLALQWRSAMGARVIGCFCALILVGAVGVGYGAGPQVLRLPLGLDSDATFVPADNPMTPEKIALGKQFFWDKRWSKSKTVAC